MKTVLAFLLIWAGLFCCLFVFNSLSHEAVHRYLPERCTRYCHDKGCPHYRARRGEGRSSALRNFLETVYRANIALLKQQSLLSYRNINILVYVFLWPGLIAALLFTAVRQRASLRRKRQLSCLAVLPLLDSAGVYLYWACTDFCINAANALGLSYPEFNFAIFVLLYPGLSVVLAALVLWQGLHVAAVRRT